MTTLALLPNQAMRARRRPRAVLALWAWEGALAFALGWPVAATVAGIYGNHPDGDAPLWAPGGFSLMSLGVKAAAAAPSLLSHSLLGLLLALALGLWSTAAILASLAYTTRDLRPPTLRQSLEAALAAFGPSAVVFVSLSLVQVALVAAGLGACHSTTEALYYRVGEARSDQAGWLVLGLFLALACVVGIVQETARAGLVRFRVSAGKAIGLGFAALRRRPLRLTWSWTWRALASVVPIAFGSLVAERLGGRGGVTLLALAGVHQAIALSRVALRASWLARALRAVDAVGSK